jgi:hypothetical protein
MAAGCREAVRVDDEVMTKVRQLEERFRERERLLGRKTLQVEILGEALTAARVPESGARVSRTAINRGGSTASPARPQDVAPLPASS